MMERLQKIIARAGFASRREAEEMIRTGRVTVNGRVTTELGSKADPEQDHVKVDGKLITRREDPRYILLYKPKEVMTTMNDPEGRKTVVDLVRGVRERIFPVGRLDFHSEGLILLTNDGDLAFLVAHPTNGSVKTYHVKVRGVPEERIIEKLRRGITIDGRRTRPCEIARMRTTNMNEEGGNSWFEVKLQEGRTQQIRKMYKAVGHPVSKLKRVAIGPIADPKLTAGQWRDLTPQEVRKLMTQKSATPDRPKRAAAKRPAAKAAGKKRAETKRPAERKKPAPRKAAASKSGKAPARRGSKPASSTRSRPTASRRSR
jgi:23S rRNA pseudouridine2605 synthase